MNLEERVEMYKAMYPDAFRLRVEDMVLAILRKGEMTPYRQQELAAMLITIVENSREGIVFETEHSDVGDFLQSYAQYTLDLMEKQEAQTSCVDIWEE